MPAAEYWAWRYSDPEAIEHHARQNQFIAQAFLRHARIHQPVIEALAASWIIEVGCGTGEFSAMLRDSFSVPYLYATDFSFEAIKVAEQRHPQVNFWRFDVLKDEPFRHFELAVCSNVLEHFRTPHTVINKLFHMADKLLIIVPFNQPATDNYEYEGGAGHVYQFTVEDFSDYKIIDTFRFRTKGWVFSSCGESPEQLVLLLAKRD